jgi:hypothetical protein
MGGREGFAASRIWKWIGGGGGGLSAALVYETDHDGILN